MARRKPQFEIHSYGIYSKWDKQSKQLPKLIDITNHIPIQSDIEFGYMLIIKGGKGITLDFRIDHPPMTDSDGNELPPFEGEEYVTSNDYRFFLGDTVWQPYEQMEGEWHLTIWHDGKLISEKKFVLSIPSQNASIKNV
jgi:hypothetical protein